MAVVTHWNFECRNCSRYQQAKGPRKMGTCEITGEKVAKTHTCRDNPLHLRFILSLIGGGV